MTFQLIEIAICIGCGCTDAAACTDPASGDPRHWLAVDRNDAIGVCSACAGWLPEFNAGRRRLSTLALLKREQHRRDTTL